MTSQVNRCTCQPAGQGWEQRDWEERPEGQEPFLFLKDRTRQGQQAGSGFSFWKAFLPVGMWGRPAPEAGMREEVASSQERI